MWPFTSSGPSPSTTSAASWSRSSAVDSSSSGVAPSPSPRVLTNSEAANPALNPLNPEGLKPSVFEEEHLLRSCCACPETKKARDDCFLKFGSNVDEHGSSAQECEKIVEAHRRCMRSLGFTV
ncbi:BQ2448_7457 [Microbotryum intermedium]|uniref:BQ2448_7457 protein n=1 Tax=Microbotryum intermedium TaxID=269621 RepID=A0A238FN01_9BASI|nr:BQ2448_7457 [Microbotryum intermedium]